MSPTATSSEATSQKLPVAVISLCLGPRASTPQQFDRMIADEVALFTNIAPAAAIKAD